MPDANSIKIDSYPPKWLKIENHNLNNSKYNLKLNLHINYPLGLSTGIWITLSICF